MSNVTLDIAGRKYTIACAAGEEAHIEMLGASINDKLAKLDTLGGQSPERILLYAALLLADELHEATSGQPAVPGEAFAVQLEALAGRMEEVANTVDGNPA